MQDGMGASNVCFIFYEIFLKYILQENQLKVLPNVIVLVQLVQALLDSVLSLPVLAATICH